MASLRYAPADAEPATIESSVSYTLQDDEHNLLLIGGDRIDGTGNELDNTITGNDQVNVLKGLGGDDRLDGMGGLHIETIFVDNSYYDDDGNYVEVINDYDTIYGDRLAGGLGNDTYVIGDDYADIIELADEGNDTIEFTSTIGGINFQLFGSIENLTLGGTEAVDGTGNAYNNVILGNSAVNTLSGMGGDDVLDGRGGDLDDLAGFGVPVPLDELIGGTGNDTYIVNGPVIIREYAGEGLDRVLSTVSFELSDNLERLELVGSAAINGTGNDDENRIEGNDAANVLDGGAGIDVLIGGFGDDTYIVDNTFDQVREYAGKGFPEGRGAVSFLMVPDLNQGNDTVKASVSFTLDRHLSVENLRTTDDAGLDAINLTGNEIANKIAGNAGANVLDGGAGVDSLAGYGGNDTYIVDDARDLVHEQAGRGTDTIMASVSYTLRSGISVEGLRTTDDAGSDAINLTGNAYANKIAGNAGQNFLTGGAGNDTLAGYAGEDSLYGGMGRDTLYGEGRGGGEGDDIFIFRNTAESGITAGTRDTIIDFEQGDLIDLHSIDANTGRSGNQSFSLDTNGTFTTGEIRQTVVDGNLLLEFNTDRDGDAEMSILLRNHDVLTASDFVL